MKSTIYVVTEVDYGFTTIIGHFYTKEEAEEYVSSLHEEEQPHFNIEESKLLSNNLK